MAKIYDKFGKPLGYSDSTGLPSHQSKGLGDTVEKFTRATGIKKAVDAVSKAVGKDCGCNKRKDKLNKMFPYKK
tara:strand:+ start:299 stop:520 length:222 start_codon:yes stop_codon:yes gene_type:complete